MKKEPDYKPVKRKTSNFYYVNDQYLTPTFLLNFAKKFHKPRKEGQTLVVIDECQATWLFGCRNWNNKTREDWCRFFQIHRHYGFDFILMCPSERLIDKAILCEVEYLVVHRKLENFGLKGKLLSLIMGGHMFVAVTIWWSIRTKVSSTFFRYKKLYGDLYDSYRDFGVERSKLAGGKEDAKGKVSVL
jgi:zona occludens toxin (predicted ATPase)